MSHSQALNAKHVFAPTTSPQQGSHFRNNSSSFSSPRTNSDEYHSENPYMSPRSVSFQSVIRPSSIRADDSPDKHSETDLSEQRSMNKVKKFIPEYWEDDNAVSFCKSCNKRFTMLLRKHHCRNCGLIYCSDCSKSRIQIKEKNYRVPVRVCSRCFFVLKKGKDLSPNKQLKHQISAMEEVSQALMAENQHLRSLKENVDAIVARQSSIIEELWQQNQLHQKEIQALRIRLSIVQTENKDQRTAIISSPMISSMNSRDSQDSRGFDSGRNTYESPLSGILTGNNNVPYLSLEESARETRDDILNTVVMQNSKDTNLQNPIRQHENDQVQEQHIGLVQDTNRNQLTTFGVN